MFRTEKRSSGSTALVFLWLPDDQAIAQFEIYWGRGKRKGNHLVLHLYKNQICLLLPPVAANHFSIEIARRAAARGTNTG